MNKRLLRTEAILLVLASFFSLATAATPFVWGRLFFSFLTFVGLVVWLRAAMVEHRSMVQKIEELTRKEARDAARLAQVQASARLLEERLGASFSVKKPLEDCLAGQSVVLAEVRFLMEDTALIRENLETIRVELTGLTKEKGPALARKMAGLAGYVEEMVNERQTVTEELARFAQELASMEAALSSLEGELRELLPAHAREIADGRTVLDESQECLGRWARPREELGAAVQAATDLAEQARILGVNASIEALRSGESGRGFSLVAEEADRLSERMLRLAHQVATQIEATDDFVRETKKRLEKGEASFEHLEALGRRIEEYL
ncbi:MAG: hypothetical protein GX493_01570, partial [Firmicutes bacterium]|nr:hypothetical protein [Bacillota bacterium]